MAVGSYPIAVNPVTGELTYDPLLGVDTRNVLTTGEELYPRDLATSSGLTSVSQVLRLSYFTARKTETSTQVRVYTGTTAAAATPTLCRIGLYQIDTAGAGTLIASIPNDTTLFAAASTAYTRSWSVSFTKTAGTRYALALLVVTAATAPTYTGVSYSAVQADAALASRLSGFLGSQSDLPASFADASVQASSSRFYGVVLP